MSKAERFASGDRKWSNDDQLAAAAEDVVAVHRRGIEGIKFELASGLIDGGDGVRDMTDRDRTGREGRLANARTHRYEVLDDGSIVDISCTGDSLDVTVVAVDSLVTDPRGFIAGGPGASQPADDE
jgi:hypothetical protein